MKRLVTTIVLIAIAVIAIVDGNHENVSVPKTRHSEPVSEKTRDVDIVIEFPSNRYPKTAAHIKRAVEEGKSNICTINRDGAEDNRKESLKGVPTKTGYDRDEFPMAFCEEGGRGADIEYVSPSDNRGAGSWISHQVDDFSNGTKVLIKIK